MPGNGQIERVKRMIPSILEQYDSGLCIRKISASTGLKASTISRSIRDSGRPTRRNYVSRETRIRNLAKHNESVAEFRVFREGVPFKQCRKCHEWLELSLFPPGKNLASGVENRCRKCELKRGTIYYHANIDKIKRKRQSPEFKEAMRAYLRTYESQRRKTDIEYKLKKKLRFALWKQIRKSKGKKSQSAIKLVGCSLVQLKLYIESKFRPGMSWENYGMWHIDHKIPCAAFDLTNPEQQAMCFRYTNLQPLWANDNLLKGDKI